MTSEQVSKYSNGIEDQKDINSQISDIKANNSDEIIQKINDLGHCNSPKRCIDGISKLNEKIDYPRNELLYSDDGSSNERLSNSKYDAVNSNGECTKIGVSSTEDLLMKENLKLEVKKLKLRRSSYGKYISKRKSLCTSENLECSEKVFEQTEIINTGDSTTNEVNYLDNKLSQMSNENAIPLSSKETRMENVLPVETSIYEEKLQKLKEEYIEWKSLLKSRKQVLIDGIKTYKEAKNGETLIEEDHLLPHTKKEIKAITLSQPDYNQYLQEIKFAKEQISLTELKVKRTSLIGQSFLLLANLASEESYKLIEQEFYDPRDPKDVLKSMMEQ